MKRARRTERWQRYRPAHWSAWFAALMLAFAMCLMAPAQAAGISVFAPHIEADGNNYGLSADFNIELSPRIVDVINRGIELQFVVDFELMRQRWYWFDARIVERSRTHRLSYHALTRQYRLSTGGLHQGFATLSEALRVLARLRSWPVAERSDLSPDTVYQAALRMRLDLSQMPRTFQVGVRAHSVWNLDSGWLRWRYQPPAADVADKASAPVAGTGLSHGGQASMPVTPATPAANETAPAEEAVSETVTEATGEATREPMQESTQAPIEKPDEAMHPAGAEAGDARPPEPQAQENSATGAANQETQETTRTAQEGAE